jgi:RNA polymerase sigma-70 factor, ECF subfamily
MTLTTNRSDANGQPFDDAAIVSRLKAGDLSACTECVEAHSDGLYRLAFRLLRDPAAAEDVVQETFLNAFKALGQFDGRSRLSTWLFRIAYNNALMRLRSQKPVEPLADDSEFEEETMPTNIVPWRETPEDIVAQGEITRVLEEAIAAIPEGLGVVFQLREVEGRSTAETAQILGLTEAAVKVRLHRARLALRARLSDYFGERVPPEPAQLTCAQVVQYLSDYIDADLDEPLTRAAREHLATCPHCHILLDTTEHSMALYRQREKRVIPLLDRTRLFREIKTSFAERARSERSRPGKA